MTALRDLTASAVMMGLLAAFVGYSASFAIVMAAMEAMDASEAQAATGLLYATLAMGLCSLVLPLITRAPSAIAWSTPGAAFLASSATLPGGFAEALGALITCGVLILITGLIPALGRWVGKIPKPIANALLAGVLLKLCLAPALALGSFPALMIPVILAWIVGLRLHRLAAMPLAVLTMAVVLTFTVDFDGARAAFSAGWFPVLAPSTPVFNPVSMISVGLPLYLVTMAGQNIPGFAVLELNNFPARRPLMLRVTGVASLLSAPFGSMPINMSAITAAMMCGEDAGADPAKRYWAATISGLGYCLLALLAGVTATLVTIAPTALIIGIAGLALVPALVGSLRSAFSEPGQLEAPALTFLTAASGMTLFGISGAFWGLVLGGVIWLSKSLLNRQTPASSEPDDNLA